MLRRLGVMVLVVVCLSSWSWVHGASIAHAYGTLNVDPSTTTPGSTVDISGAGFQAGIPLLVCLNFSVICWNVTPNDDGGFDVSVRIPISLAPGNYSLAVTYGNNGYGQGVPLTLIAPAPVAITSVSISHYDKSTGGYVDTNSVVPNEDVDFTVDFHVVHPGAAVPTGSLQFIKGGQVIDTENLQSNNPRLYDQEFFLGMPLGRSFVGNLIVRFTAVVGSATVSTDRPLSVVGRPAIPQHNSSIHIHVSFTHNPVHRGKPNIVFLETEAGADVAVTVVYPGGTGWKALGKSSNLGYWNRWFKVEPTRGGRASVIFSVTFQGKTRHFTAHMLIL